MRIRVPFRSIAVIAPLALVLAASLALAGGAVAGGRPISTSLTGAAERPNPGDPDGSGWAWVSINPGTETLCYAYEVSGVDPLTAAHIHRAPASSAGPVVIPILPTSGTGGSGCVSADRDLLVAILTDPSGYYVNVHNAAYPAGALRGQLSRQP